MSHSGDRANIGLEAESISLADLDVSRPQRFENNTHWPYFARLRRDAPMHFCPQSIHGPYWSITRFDDIVAVETDYRRFSSQRNVIIGDVPPEFDRTSAFATSDPPIHTCERKAVTPAVSPKRLANLEEQVRADIGLVLDGLPRNQTFNWVDKVSVELTSQMVAKLFDFPFTERHLLPHWCEVLVTTPQDAMTPEREAIIETYRGRITELWRTRAIEPGDDVISALARSPGTATMIDDPWHMIGTVTLIAGANEAARGALSGSVVAFHEFPDEWQKLQADPSLVSNAVSEIVRWQSPILHMRRTATQDVELRGKCIRKGDRVVMWFCSGNRDETYFQDAEMLRVTRPNARRHLGYGFGIHRCLGSHVADMQLRILLEEILKRFKQIELVAEPKRLASNFSSNYEEVLVQIPG
jgi:cytochrome P450